VNGQVDAAAVNFSAKFMDLVIWLSFQKEGATNPAAIQGASSFDDSAAEETVWLNVARALDSDMVSAMSTSFTMSKHVRPAIDLPDNLEKIDDDAAVLPEVAPSNPATGPEQGALRLSAPPNGTERSATTPPPPAISLPPSNSPLRSSSPPHSHIALAASTASSVENSRREVFANRNTPAADIIVSPPGVAPRRDAPRDPPATSPHIDETAPRVKSFTRTDPRRKKTPPAGGKETIERDSAQEMPNISISGAAPAPMPSAIASLSDSNVSAPAKRTFNEPTRLLMRSTSEELEQQNQAPQHRFSSAPPSNVHEVAEELSRPTPLSLQRALLPVKAARQSVSADVSKVKRHAASNKKSQRGTNRKQLSRLVKTNAPSSQQLPKKRKRLATICNTSCDESSKSDSEESLLASAPSKKRRASSSATSILATSKVTPSPRLKTRRSRAVIVSEDEEDEEATAGVEGRSTSSQSNKVKASGSASGAAAPHTSSLKTKGGKRPAPNATGMFALL
jgi:hypothetical protein